MRSLAFGSVLASAMSLASPAFSQLGTAMPGPYAPPTPPIAAQPQPGLAMPAESVPAGDAYPVAGQPALPLPTGDASSGMAAPDPEQAQQYDPSVEATYPEPDLGPDEQIAESYDDGYDSQAYQQFETSLAPYGSWINDASYGYVWSPSASVVGTGFVPYGTQGRWVLSEYGWTWVSDWNWGWAPFHYGRWTMLGGRGWCWVPGSMWGPAWVSWRSGAGYVGWAPLPPRGAHVFAGLGARSPWRFTTAAALGAARPTFYGSRYLPGLFARTSVVANDRLLTRGSWSVHVNAGPTHGIAGTPVHLAGVAPHALPPVAVYPRAGISLGDRPWARTAGSNAVWRAGTPEPRAVAARAPSFAGAARPGTVVTGTGWQRPTTNAAVGVSGRAYGGWAGAPAARAPTAQPSYGYGRAQPAFRPQPYAGYHAQTFAPAYHAQSYAPAPRSYAPAPTYGGASFGGGQAGGGRSFGGGSSYGGGGAHFSGGSSFGGGGNHFGGGGHRR